MNSKNHIILIVSIFLLAIGVSLDSFAQKPKTTIKNKYNSLSSLRFMDIGALTKTGATKMNGEELEVTAGGADIWGKHDQFRFGFKLAKGDFDMSVQVLSLSRSDLYTKAGIMARAGLNDSCEHVFFQVFPDNSPRHNNNGGCEFQYRTSPGEEMKAIYPDAATAGNQFDVAFPNTWIRLKRSGDVFESFVSNDGKTWKLYTTFTLKIPHELLVGLAVTAHNSTEFTKAVFGSMQGK
jgi:regulation of enolase protein 1 (concanavalin A-like superfamily)